MHVLWTLQKRLIGISPQHNRFSLEKQHLQTIRQLTNNKDLVITRPDKGKGVVIMKKSDYIAKMNDVLNDKSKFIRLGPVSEMDHTAGAETSMQDLLRSLHKKKELDDATKEKVRPVGATRLKMYGVLKVHKSNAPLRPILSMVNSPQHATAKWLPTLLKPVNVSERFSALPSRIALPLPTQ